MLSYPDFAGSPSGRPQPVRKAYSARLPSPAAAQPSHSFEDSPLSSLSLNRSVPARDGQSESVHVAAGKENRRAAPLLSDVTPPSKRVRQQSHDEQPGLPWQFHEFPASISWQSHATATSPPSGVSLSSPYSSVSLSSPSTWLSPVSAQSPVSPALSPSGPAARTLLYSVADVGLDEDVVLETPTHLQGSSSRSYSPLTAEEEEEEQKEEQKDQPSSPVRMEVDRQIAIAQFYVHTEPSGFFASAAAQLPLPKPVRVRQLRPASLQHVQRGRVDPQASRNRTAERLSAGDSDPHSGGQQNAPEGVISARALQMQAHRRTVLPRSLFDGSQWSVQDAVLVIQKVSAKCRLSRQEQTMVTALLRAFLPQPNQFPSHRTTNAILELTQTAEARIKPRTVQYCAVFTLSPAAQTAAGLRLCSQPTVYYGAHSQRPNCAECGVLRNNKKLTKSLYMIRVADWLQTLFVRSDTQEAMQTGFTGWAPPTSTTVVSDVAESKRFQRKCGAFISPAYAEKVRSPHAAKADPRNVVLMLYADGVCGTKHTDYSMFVVCCTVVNLPREQRRQRANILPLLVVPGPRPPKDMTRFLQPLIDELISLWNEGTTITTLNSDGVRSQQCVRAMLFTITADSRAHPKLSMMMQSPARYPCHLCEVQGEMHSLTEPTARHRRVLSRQGSAAASESAEAATAPPTAEVAEEQEEAESEERVDVQVAAGTGGMVYTHTPLHRANQGERADPDTAHKGVIRPCPFQQLDYLKGDDLSFFQYDAMHTIVGVLTNNNKAYKREPTTAQPNPQYTSAAALLKLESRLQQVNAPPAHMRGVVKPFSQGGLMKTADWFQLSGLGYLLYLRMCIVPWQFAVLQSGPRKQLYNDHIHQVEAMAELTNLFDALLSPTLDGAQRAYIAQQSKVAEWHFYKYMPREQHRLLAHALWHLAEQAVEYGPPTLYWMFPMERWLGYFVQRANSPAHPELSALNAILREMKCGEQLPRQLSDAIFPSPQSAAAAQYVDAPQTRPFDYASCTFRLTQQAIRSLSQHPHRATCDHCVQTSALRAQLDTTNTDTFSAPVYSSFMRALRASRAFIQDADNDKLVPHDDPDWEWSDYEVHCLGHGQQVIRHPLEGTWSNNKGVRWTQQHRATGDDAIQTYLFAIPCDDRARTMEGPGLGSGVPMECSSTYYQQARAGLGLPAIFRTVHHWPPLYNTEDVAYGFVHRWICVRQGPVQAVLARVGILSSEKSIHSYQRTYIRRFPADENPLNQDRACPVPEDARQDLFVAGHHIQQRITAAPLPFHNDEATWMVGHVR